MKKHISLNITHSYFSSMMQNATRICVIIFVLINFYSCTKFVSVPPPKTVLVSETVFDDDATAQAAMNGEYIHFMENAESGNGASFSKYLGLYSDELKNYSTDPFQGQFYSNSLTAPNSLVSNFWGQYSLIYMNNAILEGIANSPNLSPSLKAELEGEAKFLRAFSNFYLVNLFGRIPLIVSTNYQQNAMVSGDSTATIYAAIIQDLLDAQKLLPKDYSASGGERVRPNAWAATALLARVYLFTGDWKNAAIQSASVINDATDFQLAADLNNVFLANSPEAIWQLMPVSPGINTWEAVNFILTSIPTSVAMSQQLLSSFEPGDNRRLNWVDSLVTTDDTFYYPYKYKVVNAAQITEYEMVLRLAEQYLIHAEASVQLQDISNAQMDLNTIRERAGLPDILSADPQVLLTAIQKERQTELFSEWGDRWFTLKRTQTANIILPPIKGASWQITDTLLPIPTSQLENDPNMKQNPGY